MSLLLRRNEWSGSRTRTAAFDLVSCGSNICRLEKTTAAPSRLHAWRRSILNGILGDSS